MDSFNNRLAKESSPYLLQHAHNPVDWYPWGEEALQRAFSENKPILVSIGYAACHWCHVMERESFENPQTADLMNQEFICIKIDREERPDLDHIYMDAVQAMTGSGGWPLNVFLTPDTKPFYGGTYFPPKLHYNRPSWTDVLKSVAQAFRERPHELLAQSENLTRHLVQSGQFGQTGSHAGQGDLQPGFSKEDTHRIMEHILQAADKEDGGFGNPPKFPQTSSIQYLLHHYYYTKNKAALQQACLSLDKMIEGGIYDQIGGGFARYATDKKWLVPHFEKMLYDNALLVIVLSEAYQLTKKTLYRDTINQTLDFVERELSSPEGGFYAALDADSEGEEGKYYVWSKGEVEDILGSDAKMFNEYYDISEQGNWEGVNILRTLNNLEEFSRIKDIPVGELKGIFDQNRKKLISRREQRIPPMRDDKILLGWNALMNRAYAKAYAATGIETYREKAIQNMAFLQSAMKGNGIYYYYHCWKQGEPKFPGFLDDYAYLVSALLQLQEITGDTNYLAQARECTEFVLAQFGEEDTGFFYYTHRDQGDLIFRKKEVYDGATPSGNAIMAQNLYYLGIIYDNLEWKQRAEKMIRALNNTIIKYPNSFGQWATMLQAITFGIPELVITGENIGAIVKEFLANFIPAKVFQSATQENNHFPLLAGKRIRKEHLIYLCKDYACQTPETELDLIICRLEEMHKI